MAEEWAKKERNSYWKAETDIFSMQTVRFWSVFENNYKCTRMTEKRKVMQ